MGRALHAPLDLTQRAVDIGCGTGIITVEIARHAQPGVRVYGVDLEPVPPIRPRPENVEYVRGDFLKLAGKDARFQHGTFDYAFSRMLHFGIADWPGMIGTCHDLLKPGGWLEMQELDWRYFESAGVDVSQGWHWLADVHLAF